MKINFDKIFKVLVLLQLSAILIIVVNSNAYNNSEAIIKPNEIGRYKEIKIKVNNGFGGEQEKVKILDTKTGEYVEN